MASEKLKHSAASSFFPYELTNTGMQQPGVSKGKQQQKCYFCPRDNEIGEQADLDNNIYTQY